MKRIFVMAVVLLGFVFTSTAQDASSKTAQDQKKEVSNENKATAKADATLVKDSKSATKETKEKAVLADDEIKTRKEDANVREDKE